MPDQSTAAAALQIAALIKEALILADRSELSIVAIHLDEARSALERDAAFKSRDLS